jgi:hypothetical protein
MSSAAVSLLDAIAAFESKHGGEAAVVAHHERAICGVDERTPAFGLRDQPPHQFGIERHDLTFESCRRRRACSL